MPRDREDSREHGDRPQRHARSVGLDERSGDPFVRVGLGHRVDGPVVEALAQLRPSHVHEHSWQGQGSRLRDHAHRPQPEMAPRLSRSAVLQRSADGVLRMGSRAARSGHRSDPPGREAREGTGPRSQRNCRKGTQAVRQGLRGLADHQCGRIRSGAAGERRPPSREQEVEARSETPWLHPLRKVEEDDRFPRLPVQRRREHVPGDPGRELHRQHHQERVVARHHLLRSLPGSGLHLQPGGSGERDTGRVVRPSVGRRREHRRRAAVPPDEWQPELPGRAPSVPGHAEHQVLRGVAQDQGHLRAVPAPVQHRTAHPAVDHGASHDRASRATGWQGSAEARAVPTGGSMAPQVRRCSLRERGRAVA